MGACYSIHFLGKAKDEQGAILALKELIRTDQITNYNLEAYAKEGIRPDSLDGLLRIFFAGWKYNRLEASEENGWLSYQNDFDASYGWQRVLLLMWQALSDYLEPGSRLSGDYDGETFFWDVE